MSISVSEKRTNFTTSVVGKSQVRLPWPILIFLISLVFPFFFQVGPILLTPYRVVLIIFFFPCLSMWLRGKAGPVRIADIALFCMCLWSALSFFKLHGTGVAVEAGGIALVETMSAYLLARCFIRQADDFYALVRFLFYLIALLLPFALYETLTSKNILLELANKIGNAHDTVFKEPRWGFDRVQTVFSHPILFGIFCGGAPALVFYVLGYNTTITRRLFKTTLVTFTALLSLSSGPMTSLVAQLLLISWDRTLKSIKRRWYILSSGILSIVVAIEIAANRSTPEIFISYFAFNSHTASNRIRIWQFGTMSVENNPLFGIGRNEWVRPYWMSGSMDMFWLVPAVIHGLPSAIFLQLSFWALFLSIALKKDLGDRESSYRKGYLICMVGFFLGGWTVHYWKSIYVTFIFLLGSGAWILDASRPKKAFESSGSIASEVLPETITSQGEDSDNPKKLIASARNTSTKVERKKNRNRYTRFPRVTK